MNKRAKFLRDGRYGEWTKGEIASVEKVLATPPMNQNTIYILELQSGKKVWATDKDVEIWNQLTLF